MILSVRALIARPSSRAACRSPIRSPTGSVSEEYSSFCTGPPVLPIWNDGVPVKPAALAACASAGDRVGECRVVARRPSTSRGSGRAPVRPACAGTSRSRIRCPLRPAGGRRARCSTSPCFCLPAASAAICWVLNVSGSRVAVSRLRYSICSLPARTYFWISVGSAPSVKSLQIGHSQVAVVDQRHGRFRAAQRVSVLRDAADQRGDFFDRRAFLRGLRCSAAVWRAPPPLVAATMTTMITTTTPATEPSWIRRLRRCCVGGLGLLQRLALGARLLAALLAREILLVVLLPCSWVQLLQVSAQACLSSCHDAFARACAGVERGPPATALPP